MNTVVHFSQNLTLVDLIRGTEFIVLVYTPNLKMISCMDYFH